MARRQRRVFRGLCWKNLVVMRRSVWRLLFVPLVLVAVLGLFCWIGPVTELTMQPSWGRKPLDQLPEPIAVRFAPPDPESVRAMAVVKRLLPLADVAEEDSEAAVRAAWRKDRKAYGLVFGPWSDSGAAYTLLTPFPHRTDRLLAEPGSGLFPVYSVEMGMILLVAVNKAIIEVLTGYNVTELTYVDNIAETRLESMPMRKFLVPYVFGLFALIGYPLAKLTALEKAQGVKMQLSLLGASRNAYWLSWLVIALPYIAVVVVVALLPVLVLHYLLASPSVLLLLLYLEAVAACCMFFFLAAATVNATAFDMVSLAGFFVPFGIYMMFQNAEVKLHMAVKLVMSLHPGFGIFFGTEIISIGETAGKARLNDSAQSYEGQPPMLAVWLVLIFDAVLYFLLALYIDPVVPGRYGAARKWTWPCATREKDNAERRSSSVHPSISDPTTLEAAKVEAPPPLEVAVSVNGLKKTYDRRVVVKGISLDMYRGTVTALLGHNGAGKTTTVSMIAGVTSPTEGSVSIGGVDRALAGKDAVSLCPQEDLLVPQLTIREHLVLAAKMKGMDKEETEESVRSASKALELDEHQHKRPKHLSGGLMRRTSLAMSVTGHCQMLILDEPTTGTDPEVRHGIWDLISRMRQDRTILLTTHLMEEADSLADRVAIIGDGRLLCYGTASYLREQYGAGYLLRVNKRPTAAPAPLEAAVRAAVLGAQLQEASARQLVFAVPPGDAAALGGACSQLERRQTELGVESVGVATSGLEEIYLRAMKFEESNAVKRFRTTESKKELPRAVGWEGSCLQLRTLFWKEMLYLRMAWILLLVLAILNLLFVVMVGLLLLYVKETPLPPLPLRTAAYPGPVPYQAGAGAGPLGGRLEAAAAAGGGSAYSVAALDPVVKQKPVPALAANLSADGAELTALYTEAALHSLPVALVLIGNALIRHGAQSDSYSIDATLEPFVGVRDERSGEYMAFALWLLMLRAALVAWVAALAYPHLQESQSGLKRLQLAAGAPVPLYWLCRFLTHLGLSLLLVTAMVGLLQAADVIGMLSGAETAGALLWLFALYIASCLPFFYLLGNAGTGAYMLSLLMFCLVDMIVILVLDVVEGRNRYSRYGLYLLPPTALEQGLTVQWSTADTNAGCRLMTQYKKALLCSRMDLHPCCTCPEGEECGPRDPVYSQEFQVLLAYLAGDILLYGGLVLLLDSVGHRRRREQPADPSPPDGEDDDVAQERRDIKKDMENLEKGDPVERRRPRSSLDRGDLLLALQLAKTYSKGCCCRRRTAEALKGVSLRVRAGECFGVLGLNGAGKTTALRILMADTAPSAGDAVCRRHSLADCRHKFLRQLSYCPQTDPIVPSLSGRAQARLMARLRGLRPLDAEAEAELWLDIADLTEHAGMRCGRYSGGSKRKLSCVLALAGRPPLALLDEPSAGVDPAARRNLTAALLAGRAAGRSLLLCSHSMAECEALCDRVAILRAGRAACVGSLPHLKHKFRRGCWLSVQLASHEAGRRRAVARAVLAELGRQCSLRTELPMMLKFELQQRDLSWAQLFASMERLAAKHADIASYAVSETTLEDIFLSFREDGDE